MEMCCRCGRVPQSSRETATLDRCGECRLDSFCAGCSELPQYFLCRMDIESSGREAVRYFISSLTLSDWEPEKILSLIRDHLPIGNESSFFQFVGNAANGFFLILSSNQCRIGSLNHHNIVQTNERNKMFWIVAPDGAACRVDCQYL